MSNLELTAPLIMVREQARQLMTNIAKTPEPLYTEERLLFGGYVRQDIDTASRYWNSLYIIYTPPFYFSNLRLPTCHIHCVSGMCRQAGS
jgi:hypothetical protein